MPLFKSHPDQTDQRTNSPPARKPSIFARNRSASPPHSEASGHTSPSARRGFFGGRNSSSSDDLSRNGSGSVRSGGGRSFFGFNNSDIHNDPSILAARQKVTDAGQAERDADQALAAARASVREAKEHVKFLEREAKEE